MKHIFYIAAALLLIATFSYRSPSVQPTYKDTFRYFRTIDEHTLAANLDSLGIVYPKVGRTLPADQADAYQALMYRVLVRFSNMRRDSVKVSNGREVK